MDNKVEFKLKFLLNSLTLKVLDVKDMSDPKKVLSFNNRFCDSKKVQAFCSEASNLSAFPLLGVPLCQNSKIHKAYFCEVSVGRSLFVSNEYAQTLDVPKDYDSFIVAQNDAKGFLTDANIDISTFSYIIKDTSRVLLLYEVTFEYDEELEKLSRKSFICHRCKKSQSTMFCPSERASFCKDCDIQVHNDEFLKRHSRIYFSDVGQKKFICCLYHPTKVVEYFCETCMDPICADCKITGNHSGRDKCDHHIISFLEACQILKSKISDWTKPVAGRVENCNRELCRFKDKVGSFKDNITAVRRQIEKEFKSLLLQLDSIENAQRQIINAKYAERVAIEEFMKRTETYPHELDPADLLLEFNFIQELTKSESQPVFDKYDPERIETHGKMSLLMPKDTTPKCSTSDSKDKSIRWRIETMHMTKEQDSNLH
ncbi:uncharacterized protein VICG_01503 [Vittaforma corneae ATCC 50505]|uniref:B box-type domain-containing protein n=1 Tax=Vittaforma corneae (strain ATCC 50505) TaxID=993615 RepID=L2GKI8_VITCO|nr:uncharacterized protein VICG_01503 [Vittaforma corneae ATCC 50505]ELA41398.1 hypothetical protein VICG_01503 [Vittaforma corneae ATCC 50505]